MSFWKELKRRNVVKVGIAYAIAAWLIIHPVDIIFPVLHLPEWSITLVTALLIIALPFVLIFSWVYEITSKGLKKTKKVPVSKSIAQLTGKKLNYIIVGLLIVAVAYLLFDKYYINRHAIETKQIPKVSKVAKTKKTIAVLSFTDLSPVKDQGYFVDGLSEEILNSLTQIPDLNVIARTSSFSFKETTKTVQEIASILGVEYILEGSVRKAGSELRIAAQLVRASDGVHLWSEIYDQELKDIFTVQEEIANNVADKLKLTLEALKQLGGTDNVDAYAFYMVAQGQITDTEYSSAIASLDSALAMDPAFALAWASKATLHIFSTVMGPIKNVASERDTALHAAMRAIELKPNLAAGYYALGYVKTTGGEFIEGGKAYRKALELSDEPLSFIVPLVAVHYQAVGYFKKEQELLEEMLLNDPLNQGIRGFYIMCLGYLGETLRAEEEDEHARALFGDTYGSGNPGITIVRLGSGRVISRHELVYSDPVLEAVKTHLDSPEEGLSELRRLYADADELSAISLQMMVMCAAYFGDPEFAMEVLEKAVDNVAEYVFILWQPVMSEVRQLPRFKEFVREIGLIDYWNEFGWPDICHQLDNGDFECD